MCSGLPFPHGDKVAEHSVQQVQQTVVLSVSEGFGPWLFGPTALGPVVHAQSITGEACG